jgi:hypothetical protein
LFPESFSKAVIGREETRLAIGPLLKKAGLSLEAPVFLKDVGEGNENTGESTVSSKKPKGPASKRRSLSLTPEKTTKKQKVGSPTKPCTGE